MPGMFFVLFDLRNHLAHLFQHWRSGVVVNVALQKFQHVQTIPLIVNEVREQYVEPVVDRDEVIPVLGSATQSIFVVEETFPREIIFFESAQNVFVRKSRTIQRNAYAGGKDGIDETSGIADHQKAIAAKLLHGIAVVAFIFEWTNAIRFTQSFFDHGPSAHRAPEKLLAIFFGLGEILFLGYDPDAGHIVRDWNLPDPGVRNRQEVNVNVVEVRIALGKDFAVVTIEPCVNGILVEHRILNLELHLIAQEGIAAAGIHYHFCADIHFLRTHVEADDGFLGAEVNRADLDTVVDRRAQFVGVLQQHQIKPAAIHMVSVVLVDAGLLALVEADVDIAIRSQSLKIVHVGDFVIVRGPHRAIFMRKLGCFHLRQEVQIPENSSRRRHKGLADVRPRKQLPLEYHATYASLGQVGGHRRSSWSSTNNSDIKIGLRNNQCCLPK